MAANVLNSPEAVRMSVFVVRTFIQMRELLGSNKELAKQLADLKRNSPRVWMSMRWPSLKCCGESWTYWVRRHLRRNRNTPRAGWAFTSSPKKLRRLTCERSLKMKHHSALFATNPSVDRQNPE